MTDDDDADTDKLISIMTPDELSRLSDFAFFVMGHPRRDWNQPRRRQAFLEWLEWHADFYWGSDS